MFYFIGGLQLILLCTFLVWAYKKSGITILTDAIKLMLILWLTTIGLYNLQLSKLYSPTWMINIVVMIIVATFFIASTKVRVDEVDVKNLMKDLSSEKDNAKIYSIVTNIIFIVAFIIFLINIAQNGLAILDQNKINKQQIGHYSGYIIHMLALCAQIKYILFRTNKKISDGIVFILSIGTLVLTLNRGPIAFIVAAIYIYELYNLIKIKDTLSKKKLYGLYAVLIIGFLVFLQFFGYIGDLRMEYVLNNVYHRTINEHYQMSKHIPSGFLWGYMYSTSPLENASYSLINQNVEFTYFNNLLYPFIKLFANILGFGGQYKLWVKGRMAYTPHLEKSVGLNVSSFIPDAMQDLGYIGLIIYVGIFVAIAYYAIRIIKNRGNKSAIGSIAIYVNILNILMWSIFSNSLKIPILILNIFLVLFIEFLINKGFFEMIGNIIPIRRNK